MDSLATQLCPGEIRDALLTLPTELDGIYDQAMERIDCQNNNLKGLAHRVLSWVFLARRPLSLAELREAVAVKPGDTSLHEDRLLDEDTLVSVCVGLVVVDQQGAAVRLVHFTAQDYMERIHGSRFPCARTEIAEACITYLSFDTFAVSYDTFTRPTMTELEKENPLFCYTSYNWADHIRGESERAIPALILKFLSKPSYALVRRPLYTLETLTTIDLATCFNFHEIVLRLLSEGLWDDVALHVASERGHHDIV
jgi:hypothetical protein